MITINKLITAGLSAVIFLGAVAPVFATQEVVKIDQCGEQFNYSKSQDYADTRVTIDYTNTQSAGNPDTVGINAEVANGYKLVKVELDVSNDDQNGYVDHTSDFPGTFNPNPGETINGAKVVVEKTCTPVCNDKEATNFEELKEGETIANNELCTYPTPEPPVATPSATPTPKATPELPKTGGGADFVFFGLGVAAIGLAGKILFRKRD